jgi:DNA-binding SARP family transcriptional activator
VRIPSVRACAVALIGRSHGAQAARFAARPGDTARALQPESGRAPRSRGSRRRSWYGRRGPTVEFRILGPVEVQAEGRALSIRSERQRCLLALLLLNANRTVSLETAIDELWADDPPAKPVDAVQELVYQLRNALEQGLPRGSVLQRQGAGYRIVVGRDELDLQRFEHLVRMAEDARKGGALADAVSSLRKALALWRGPALANVRFDPRTAAQVHARRLDEVRLSVLIERLELDFFLGSAREVVPELEALVAEHPLNERLRELLMRALYGSGRQADALAVYQETLAVLREELGIDPNKRLQELHRAILRHDAELDVLLDREQTPPAARPPGPRSIVAVALEEDELDSLLALAEPLARSQQARELLLTLILEPADVAGLRHATSAVQQRRSEVVERGGEARAAAFTSAEAAHDIARLVEREGVDLLLLVAPTSLVENGTLTADTTAIAMSVPCDLGLLVPREEPPAVGPIIVPFGGDAHDWAALELGAWLASASETPLVLLGVAAVPATGRRDASRALADASLAVQWSLGIATDVRLVEAGGEMNFLRHSSDASLLVLGMPDRWHREGIGSLRQRLARDAAARVLLVKKGARPGALAPRELSTIFAWSLAPAARDHDEPD